MTYILHGKTGWYDGSKPGVGWWVAWIERDGNLTAMALNIDMSTMADAPKRLRIARAVLRDLKLLGS
ncbi:Beta-lactamase OXA-10 [Pandoraea terrae]|uniref:Beta-lactamase OXA-10 n=1 Tax=Pandoraea terrae TaxID=1537710 RepID=A0A5E4SXN9_9BURK|nr:Beta-lactamase OXA-10 [Pandoraea terrae]